MFFVRMYLLFQNQHVNRITNDVREDKNGGNEMKKLDLTEVMMNANKYDLQQQQVVVSVMCGGGMLGRFAAEQPADFVLSDKKAVGLPFEKKEIEQAVEVLAIIAKHYSFDPHNLPSVRFHNCGVF